MRRRPVSESGDLRLTMQQSTGIVCRSWLRVSAPYWTLRQQDNRPPTLQVSRTYFHTFQCDLPRNTW